jgi:predicted enzyme related to lactoylglutathione lyase
MVSSIRWISVDCADPFPLSRFYGDVTGWPTDADDRPGHDECAVLPPAAGHPGLLFTRGPEPKSEKNRLYLDLHPLDRTRDEEVERVIALGATLIADRRGRGQGWIVLADPEGNEFCMNTSPAEREERVTVPVGCRRNDGTPPAIRTRAGPSRPYSSPRR